MSHELHNSGCYKSSPGLYRQEIHAWRLGSFGAHASWQKPGKASLDSLWKLWEEALFVWDALFGWKFWQHPLPSETFREGIVSNCLFPRCTKKSWQYPAFDIFATLFTSFRFPLNILEPRYPTYDASFTPRAHCTEELQEPGTSCLGTILRNQRQMWADVVCGYV